MNIFSEYATYYNALYQDKSYQPEAEFVLNLARNAATFPTTLLDLGCGTARHALELARLGVQVTGVDMSAQMLAHAAQTLDNACLDEHSLRPVLLQGDARTVRLGRRFDVVTSLFHVMSYQTTEEDALDVLSTAHAHLAPMGLFIFDFWYGPCVLRERPEYRERELRHGDCSIQRTATPELLLSENIVNVHYNITLKNPGMALTHIHETHSMRYWFLPELRYLSRQTGFRILGEGAWLSHQPPTDESWGAWLMLQK